MVDTLHINDELQIPIEEIELRAVRSQGAGGQNVNKVASAIHLRFDFENSGTLPDAVRNKLRRLDDQRVTAGGIVIKAQEHRTQARNREAALARLAGLIRDALAEKPPRVPTRPSKSVVRRRIDDKRRRGERKRSRQRPDDS